MWLQGLPIYYKPMFVNCNIKTMQEIGICFTKYLTLEIWEKEKCGMNSWNRK